MANPATDFTNFLGGDPSFEDFITRGIGKTQFGEQDIDRIARDTGSTVLAPLGGFGGTSLALGLGSLNEILSNRGRTDPRAFNQLIASSQRRGQVRGDQLTQAFAGRNLGGGLLDALQLNNQQGTSAEIGGIESAETQRAEDRRRSDLDLLLRLIIDPSLTAFGVERGVATQRANAQSQQQGGYIAALAEIYGAGLGGD